MSDSSIQHTAFMRSTDEATPSLRAPLPPSASDLRATSSDGSQKIRIVIADPIVVTSELLKQALSSQPDCEISGCSRNLEELEAMIASSPPHIVLIKASTSKGAFDPIAILETVHAVSPATRSIVLSSDLSKQDVIAYFHSQARGILPADMTDFATMCRCIHAVFEGQIWASSEQLDYLIESLSAAKPVPVVSDKEGKVLSAREREVLGLLAEGKSNRSMAATLKLSEHTIKNHLFHIFYKLGVSSRTEAVLYAVKQGPIPEPRKLS